MNYEIYIDDDAGSGLVPVRGIRRTGAGEDGRLVFATFTEAKRVLVAILTASIAELIGELAEVRANRQDIRNLRKGMLDKPSSARVSMQLSSDTHGRRRGSG